MMKKPVFIAGSALCVSLAWAQKQPNVVLILADDMRGSTLEFLGKEDIKTPALNSFSKESVVFTNAHIMGGTSGAVSMPSRAMLMTGKYLYNLEKQGETIPESHITMGEVLRGAGYTTFHTGKWHGDKESFNRCFSSGDDIFFGGMHDHWNVPLFHYDPAAKYKSTRRVIPNWPYENKTEVQYGEYMYAGRHSVDIFTDTAVRFINEQSGGDKPFLLSLCYMSPHDPRNMPDEFWEMYDPEKTGLPANFMKEHPFDNGELIVRDEELAATPREEAEIRRHIADYYAMISHLDNRIGKVIEALKENGQYDNTIIIFTADNGLAVGQHGLMGKQNLYEHSVGVPLMIKPADNFASPGENDKLCYLTDLLPTICELTGQDIPSSVDGVSFAPVMTSGQAVREDLYFAYRDFQRAMSDGEWKLIVYRVKGVETIQLFNLKQDPMEINNLYGDKKYRKIVERLQKRMQESRIATNDNSVFWE